MKTALITTTINVPTVLALYRKLDPTVKFYVAADEKTPLEAYSFCGDIPDCEIYSPDRQKELGYECSSLLGWNNDSRRNIALLEALKEGAELIISIDDDMIPNWDHSWHASFGFQQHFERNYSGLQLGVNSCWFDAGQYTIPSAKQRGLPPDRLRPLANPQIAFNAEIGAAQGIILGVPDTDAMTAISSRPQISSVTDVLRNGFVVDPNCMTVFNSQFTAFRRELAPAFAQFYQHQGRNTDIFASLLMRRLMQDRDLYTYFGPPMAFHARQPRPLLPDLKAEMFGLEHIQEWAEYLNRAPSPSYPNAVNECATLIAGFERFTSENKEVAIAFLNDCEKVL